MKIYSEKEINLSLKSLLQKGDPFSCIRLGNTENYILNSLYNNQKISLHSFSALYNIAGVFPLDIEFYKKEFLEEGINVIKNSDIIGWVDIIQPEPNTKFKNNLLENKICFTEIQVLDPCVVVNYEDPWTAALKDKKVLVVSPHYESIIKQWKNKENIWGENVNKILPFELVDVIKSPHPPHVEGGDLFLGSKKAETWIDVKNFLQDQINEYDYDVLLTGCGAYAPSLSSFAKNNDKMAITPCGATQLFFGVYGKRWTENKNFVDQHRCFNEHWCYPLKLDEPQNKHIIETIEGKCYW